MFPIVARSARPSSRSPGPKNSTNLATTPFSRSISVTRSTRSVAVDPSGSSPVSLKPITCGSSIEIGWPSIAASASIPPTPQPSTPSPLIIVVWESVPTSVSGYARNVGPSWPDVPSRSSLHTTLPRYSRLTWWQIPVAGGTTRKLSNAVWPQRRNAYRSPLRSNSRSALIANARGLPNASTWTEWSMIRSTGTSGLIAAGSPPSRSIASRIAVRSTIAGTPVKSCISTRLGWYGISTLGSAFASQVAIATTSSRVTELPSSSLSTFSSRTCREYGSRATSYRRWSASSRWTSYSRPATSRVDRAPKLSLTYSRLAFVRLAARDALGDLRPRPAPVGEPGRDLRPPHREVRQNARDHGRHLDLVAVALDRGDDRVRDLVRRCRAEARRGLGAAVVEHPRLAHEPGGDERHADPPLPQVLAQPQRETAQPELRRRVQRCARGDRLARQRRHVHQVAAPPLLHPGKDLVGEPNRRLEVDPQHPAQFLGAEVLQPARAGEAGVGDQDVDRAGVGGEPRGGVGVGEVGDHSPVPIAGQAARELVERLRLAGAEHERGPAAGQRGRDRTAQAAGRTAQQHRLRGQLHGINLPDRPP